MSDIGEILLARPDRERVEGLIEKSPAPALARTNVLRLIESAGLGSWKAFPAAHLEGLVQLLGGSPYLSDVLIRQGELWSELFLEQIGIEQKTASDHLGELAPWFEGETSFEDFARALRRHKRREYLRIGARDLLPQVDVEVTMRELTALADAALEAAYRFARKEVEKDFGLLRLPESGANNGFVILGMGKLGGEELNFSSDIDIVFLYEEDEGESEGGVKGRASPRRFFTALAERITRLMGEVSEDGFVFRTDLRLRPLGRHGPLVQSVSSALLYYESWGQCWERAALIKARPVAGEKELGLKFLREIEPFIYRRYLDYTTVEELRHTKARIEKELLSLEEKERNVKLGRGGIREIEFFVQTLQLVNGGYDPRIRERNTLRALSVLARSGYIPSSEEARLKSAYCFLRDVEHKIQMVREAHAHSIPRDEGEERALARRLGYRPENGISERELFWRDYRSHTASVREAFDRLFYGAQREIPSDFEATWNDLDREDVIVRELRRLGFSDPERAYRHLLAIRDGERYSPPSARRLRVMRILGPALMAELLRCSSPERALFNFAEFSHRVGARTGFLSLLAENPKTLSLLITFFAESQVLTDLLLKRPELLDSLIRVDLSQPRKGRAQMLGEILGDFEDRDLEQRLNRLRRYRAEEFIRIGLHDLGGALGLEEVQAQLSDLAEACLEAALKLAFEEMNKSYGGLEGRFSILGLGKFGGREIDYNSDLDLIFIYDAREEARSAGARLDSVGAHEYYVRLGQKLITFLSAPTEEGIGYKIDMRLRPSGRFGPLVSSLEAFRHYHRKSAELWERQALIKARFVAGDPTLGEEAEETAAASAYRGGLSGEGLKEIHHLRMRMERELGREDASQFNLKKGKGGIVDIEFIAQMLQLAHGYRHPGLRKTGTLQALAALRDHGIIAAPDYDLLWDSYLFLRRLDHRLRLERDQSIDILEREPGRLQAIAHAMGYGGGSGKSPGELLLEDYERRREQVRSCYERIFGIEGA